VRGNERLRWDQPAASVDALRALRFVATIDGAATPLDGVRCSETTSLEWGFPCEAPLPRLSPGLHTLSIAALRDDEVTVEGPPSDVLYLEMIGTASLAQTASTSTPGDVVGSAVVVTTGLADATDLAVLPADVLLIAERRGAVRVVRSGVLQPEPAVLLSEVATGDGRGLLGLAADPDIEKTGYVFVAYTTADGLRVARLSWTGASLVSHATILEGLPISAERPHAALRIGPDARIYVALDDQTESPRGDDLGAPSGKVLRFNQDGTTPRDGGVGAIHMSGVFQPLTLVWWRDAGSSWVLDRRADGQTLLHAAPAAPSSSLERRSASRFSFPASLPASALLALPNQTTRDIELVAAFEAASPLLRMVIDSAGATMSTSWWSGALPEGVRALALSTDQASIYACTAASVVRVTAERP
jgi:hypothetical protein